MLRRFLPVLPLLVDLLPALILSVTIRPADGTTLPPTSTGSIPTPIAQVDSNNAVKAYAQEIAVRIQADNNQGSGTLLAKQNNVYLVLTNAHVLRGAKTLKVQTHDGQTYPATAMENPFASGYDLALVTFVSNQSYALPELGNFTPRPEQSIISAGYIAGSQAFQSSTHQLQQILPQPLQGGYQLGYPGKVKQGMSGGPIIETTTGELVGINGQNAFPLVDDYKTLEGQALSPETIQKLRRNNWGIPLQTALAQIQSNLLTAYGLPQPLVASTVKTAQTQGWVADLEAKAKTFTLRINSSTGANGSGVLIAKQGKTYTVLTANHVVCEAPNGQPPCPSKDYSVVAPDGQVFAIDSQTIQRQEGIDLAIFTFQSDADYAIATFGDYNPRKEDEVFVAGFPKVNQAEASWQFNSGKVFDQNEGFLKVNSYSVRQNDAVFALPQASFGGGYELVYTSITYGGMSGGVVLDRQGQVIGIHGLAEGESETGDLKIQLGLSLGIPTRSVLGTLPKFNIRPAALQVSSTAPAPLSARQQAQWKASVLQVDVPTSNAKAEVWIERGNQLWRLEQYTEALAAFDRAIQLKPSFVHLAWYGKALVYRSQEKYSAAETALLKVVELKPNYKPGWQVLSVVYRLLKKPEQALMAVNTGLKLAANDAQLLNEKYVVLSELYRYPEALTAINAAIAQAPRSAFYINRGWVLIKMDRYEEALAALNQAIEIDANMAIAYTNRGVTYVFLKQPDAAIADYQKALTLDPQYVFAYSGLGMLYHFQKRHEEALTQFVKGIAVDPKNPINYSGQGFVYFARQQYKDAIAAHTQAIELEPESANDYFSRANVYIITQQYQSAIADLTKAIQLAPPDPIYFNSRGDAYAALNQPEAALADYSQAIEVDKNNTRAYIGLGTVYQNTRQYQRAIANFDKAIEVADFPQKLETNKKYKGLAYSARGFLYSDLGKLEQAIADFSRAIELSPKATYLYRARALNYTALNRYQEALADYTQAIKIAPKVLSTYIRRGKVYRTLGQEAEANADFQKVLMTEPSDSQGYGVRADVYKSLKRYPEALADYTKAIELAPPNPFQRSLFHSSRAQMHGNLQQYEQAHSDYSKALALLPNPTVPFAADLYIARGNNFLSWQRQDDALADFNQAIGINPKNVMAYVGRGRLSLGTQKYQDALADFNTVIQLNPKLGFVYDFRSRIYQALNRIEDAIADADKLIELQTNAASYTRRGILYALAANPSLARKDFQQAITLNPKAIIPTVNLGLIYYEQGSREQAITQFQRAIELDGSLAEPQLALAAALHHGGQQQQAITLAQSALKQDPKLREVEFLQQNLWGERLIVDVKKLLAELAVQAP
ncbi:serine protease [Acaryochloris sp. IP29b_bin.137]|uniref:serine protease n=1 Tax=Acaryochloris sp. IP29b_bin.137 TaxID=2969217 RepID=UPI00261C4381|nr:serine protease [Acaryochloris sp. IP29b_bin.137]